MPHAMFRPRRLREKGLLRRMAEYDDADGVDDATDRLSTRSSIYRRAVSRPFRYFNAKPTARIAQMTTNSVARDRSGTGAWRVTLARA